MGPVRITSWNPLNSRSIHRMTGLGSNRPFAQLLPGLETEHPVTVGQSPAHESHSEQTETETRKTAFCSSETLISYAGDWPTVTGCPVSNPGYNCANGRWRDSHRPSWQKNKKNNIITTKVSCRELGILLLRRHLILVVKNFSSRCESEPKFVVKQRWRPTQRPKREVLYFTHKYLNGSLVHKLKCVCSKVVGADVLNGWCQWWNINGVEVQETWTLC